MFPYKLQVAGLYEESLRQSEHGLLMIGMFATHPESTVVGT